MNTTRPQLFYKEVSDTSFSINRKRRVKNSAMIVPVLTPIPNGFSFNHISGQLPRGVIIDTCSM